MIHPDRAESTQKGVGMKIRKRLTICLSGVLLMMAGAALALENRLKGHASPYLAMHGNDPVHWQEWGPEAWAAAKKTGKLLYVSSGYFSCHWCHVMQRESYQNPDIAAFLNANFIPVKVDRELNPALDAKLIDFVERTRGQAGWPLNVFITPGGYPLVGMVYLPPENFKSMLEQLASRWQSERADLNLVAQSATVELLEKTPAATTPLASNAAALYTRLLQVQSRQISDPMEGGFGEQSKFPSAPQLRVLLEIYADEKKPKLGKFLQLTLDQMAGRGLYDHIGGGFFRYTVDPGWYTPHFEKMLYDNALLARLYLRAAEVFDKPEYRQVAFETLDFMLRDLATDTGALAASLSAVDDKGQEGAAYLWQLEDVKALLDKSEWAVAELVWDLTGIPELDGFHLFPHLGLDKVARQLGISRQQAEARLASAKRKLLKARLKRPAPKDAKPLAAWNALALSALVDAARIEKKYRQPAKRIHDYLVTVSWNGREVQRAVIKGKPAGQAGLEDYAYLAEALLHWARLSGKPADYEQAAAVARQAWQKFHTANGWRLKENSWFKYGYDERVVADGVMPSPSAILLQTTLVLARRLDDRAWYKQAEASLNQGDSLLSEAPHWYASQIEVIRRYQANR